MSEFETGQIDCILAWLSGGHVRDLQCYGDWGFQAFEFLAWVVVTEASAKGHVQNVTGDTAQCAVSLLLVGVCV